MRFLRVKAHRLTAIEQNIFCRPGLASLLQSIGCKMQKDVF